MSQGPFGVVERLAIGAAWSACVIGLSVVALTIPVYTTASVQWLRVPASAGLSAADTIRLAGLVRALVADQEYDPLPRTWRGQAAFDGPAVSHLEDVRAVITGARIATGIAASILAAWIGFGVARHRWSALADGMRTGGWLAAGLAALAIAAAVTDFDVFFTAFHGVFFRSGTWRFASDSMLIRVFPERFWETAGAAWAALVGAGAAALLVSARYVPKAASSGPLGSPEMSSDEEDSSRMAEDV